jgi:hypothetical protein
VSVSPGRVHAVSAVVVDYGDSANAVIDLSIDADTVPTLLTWKVGAAPNHNLCGRALDWRLEVDESATVVPANEPRQVRLRASSGNRPVCNPAEYVAKCGEPVRLIVMTGSDDIVATFDTTYECLLRIPR